jgi:hypothetical protein
MALKLGTENKTKVILAGVLGVIVLGLLVRMLVQSFGSSTPAPVAATPPPTATPARSTTAFSSSAGGTSATRVAAPANLDPTLHPELMAATEALLYSGKGRNIFSQFSAPVEIPKPVKVARNDAPPVPTGPPPPPNIDLKFFGYSSATGGLHQVFLLHGEDIFIAKEGDVVDRRYRVEKIANSSVQVTDLPYNHTQTLPLILN